MIPLHLLVSLESFDVHTVLSNLIRDTALCFLRDLTPVCLKN